MEWINRIDNKNTKNWNAYLKLEDVSCGTWRSVSSIFFSPACFLDWWETHKPKTGRSVLFPKPLTALILFTRTKCWSFLWSPCPRRPIGYSAWPMRTFLKRQRLTQPCEYDRKFVVSLQGRQLDGPVIKTIATEKKSEAINGVFEEGLRNSPILFLNR